MKQKARKDALLKELQQLEGEQILIVTTSDQLRLFGQTFRPVFCGTISEVEHGHITLFPVIIKLVNAPFFNFPTPLSIPLERIAHYTTCFDCNTVFPLT